ncbi:GTP cyclohydrolase II [Aestuariivivens sediminicola]|uniref:GTP cyclohydrolase II n=1 Tax=Aestuariivivens sediminicola TaxID=2913560 RepID=UPI001F5630E1|nr:GTP cyclohydrolase II [Aestuariivivens sediminicola]
MNKSKFLVESRLPTKYGEFLVKAYRSTIEDFPHLALYTSSLNSKKVVDVRIHSECMTGDVFSSVKCDCGEQLKYSLKWAHKNAGVVVYLRQEGRGIGLINKLKAYNLQEKGFDTKDANLELGFHEDSRDYGDAIEILEDLGIFNIRLLTNNPEKINSFEHSNIRVVERLPIEIKASNDNAEYLKTKKNRMGHLFSQNF